MPGIAGLVGTADIGSFVGATVGGPVVGTIVVDSLGATVDPEDGRTVAFGLVGLIVEVEDAMLDTEGELVTGMRNTSVKIQIIYVKHLSAMY